jgi:hypothetical protein
MKYNLILFVATKKVGPWVLCGTGALAAYAWYLVWEDEELAWDVWLKVWDYLPGSKEFGNPFRYHEERFGDK